MKAVQSCHATWELASKGHKHPSLVLVVVRNENKLKKVMRKLEEDKIKFEYFREPDLNNEITSLCTEPVNDIEYLKRFQLLGG
jgi:hypothetical protein